MAGRKTKLTPLVQERICESIRLGNYKTVAAQSAGVHIATLIDWENRGTGEHARQPYIEFVEALTEAENQSERALVGYWRVAAAKDWRAARDLLARRFPDRWKDQSRVQVTGSLDLVATVRELAATAGLTDEEIAEAETIVAGAG